VGICGAEGRVPQAGAEVVCSALIATT
jgi:hypothetical protein